MSWKNRSTGVNELQGEATYKVPDPRGFGYINTEVTVSLDSFKTAHELWGVLEAAYNLGRASAQLEMAEQLRSIMKPLYAANGRDYP